MLRMIEGSRYSPDAFVELSRPSFPPCLRLWSTALLVNNSPSPLAFKCSIASPKTSAYLSSVGARAFPRPEDLAALKPKLLRRLGFSRQKAGAIIELSRAIVTDNLDRDGLASLDDESAVEQLRGLHGVGRWTAEYVLLRGLGRLHIFPGDDVGARNTLQQWLGLRKPLDYNGTRRVLAKWKPYAGLTYFHMLLYRLNETGYLSCPPIKSGGTAS